MVIGECGCDRPEWDWPDDETCYRCGHDLEEHELGADGYRGQCQGKITVKEASTNG